MAILNPNYSNINYDEVAAAIGLKAKHMPMLIGSFLEESQTILNSLESAIQSNDYASVKASAHSIKGSAGNLKFDEVYKMAQEMEHSAEKSATDFEYNAYFKAIKEAILTIPA